MLNTISLSGRKKFKILYETAESFANRSLVVYFAANNEEINKLGIVVSKKIGNSPKRHRFTRIIKEAYRINEHKFKKGYDIVIIARTSNEELKTSDMEKAIIHIFQKINLMVE